MIDDLVTQYVEAAKKRDALAAASDLFPNLHNAAYALSPRPPIESLVENMLDRGTSNLIYGQWGSKKTWAIQYLFTRIAANRPFLGMTVQGGPVLYFDEENGDAEISDRFAKCIRGSNAKEDIPLWYNCLSGINLLKNPNDATKIITQAKALDVVAIAFDTLAAVMAGGDENSVRDTEPVLLALRKIAEESGAAILTIHHTGKNDDYRGSSAIAGAVNDMIRITSAKDSPFIIFKSEKKRRGKPFEFAARATWTDDQFYLDEAELIHTHQLSKSRKFVIDRLEECGELSIRNIVDAAGDLYSRDAIKKAFQFLVEENLIHRTDPGGAGVEAFYAKS